MRFGLGQFTLQIPPWDKRTHAELYADTLELAGWAEDAGFDSFWLAEHHAASDGYIPSTLPFLAAVAARTRTIELGTAVLLAPFHDPLRIAEDAAVVDNISNGRLNLGLGLGWAPEEYRMFRAQQKGRGKRLGEFAQVLKAAWTKDRVTFEGEYLQYDDIEVAPKPARAGGPPVWLGGNAEAALRRSARFGDGYFPPSSATFDTLPDLAANLLAKRKELNPEQPYRFGSFQNVGLGDDEDDGWRSIRDGVMHVRGSYMLWGQGARDVSGAREAAEPFEEQIRSTCIVGSPEQVAAKMRPTVEKIDALGFADTFTSVILAPPGTPADRARAAIDRFARDVIPALRS
ncbi:MAG TPA: LLM class flavin-dependent oxidoreductase [Actinomycetota bacterium]|nr:LLM class flavin-dependent oxidoreductase [Actinomycetota bacterium]